MLPRYRLLSTVFLFKPKRRILPRFRKLGSRLLNAVVILSFILPNASIAVQAAIPEKNNNINREETGSPTYVNPEGMDDSTIGYQHPVYSHPKPRINNGLLEIENKLQVDKVDSPSVHDLPLLFVENEGQFHDTILFQMKDGDNTANFSTNSITVSRIMPIMNEGFSGEVLLEKDFSLAPPDQIHSRAYTPSQMVNFRFTFEGADPNPTIKAINLLDTKVSYLIGDNRASWPLGVSAWAGVRYENLYEGVDLEITSEKGNWKWRVFADGQEALAQVRLRIEGADQLQLNNEYLLFSTQAGDFNFPLIEIAEGDHGRRITGATLKNNTVNSPFSIPEIGLSAQHNGSEPSQLLSSTFIGGVENDNGWDVAVDSSGNSYLAGYTSSLVFTMDTPAPGVYPLGSNGWDAFVAKLNPLGTEYEYFTFLGGSGDDYGYGIALVGGEAVITGRTTSTDFPVSSGAYQGALSGAADSFVTKINSTGTNVDFSTYLGGSGNDWVEDIVIHPDTGEIRLVGSTESSDFPMILPADIHSGGFDVFLTRMDPAGNPINSVYLGSSGYDIGKAIDLDSCGRSVIGGYTDSPEFPVFQVFTSVEDQIDYGGGSFDGFFAIIGGGADYGGGSKVAFFG